MSAATEKVKKLLAMANDKSATEAEAESFRQKAFEIMMREGISEDDVIDKDRFKVESKRLKLKSTAWREDVVLAGIVARANGAVIRYQAYQSGYLDTSRNGAYAVFYGLQDQIDMCEMMFSSLIAQRGVAIRKRQNKYETPREFASGFNAGLQMTFKRAAAKVENEVGSILPILKSMRDRINAELSKTCSGRMTTARPGQEGVAAGLAADAGLHGRLSNSASRGLNA